MLDALAPAEARAVPLGITRHACERCEERLGFWPTEAEVNAALLAIFDRRGALLLAAALFGKEHWLVRFGDAEARVVYDPGAAAIITVYARGFAPARRVANFRKARAGQHVNGRERRERTRPEQWGTEDDA